MDFLRLATKHWFQTIYKCLLFPWAHVHNIFTGSAKGTALHSGQTPAIFQVLIPKQEIIRAFVIRAFQKIATRMGKNGQQCVASVEKLARNKLC